MTRVEDGIVLSFEPGPLIEYPTVAVWPPRLLSFDPLETCWSCGYAIGAHEVGQPCPTESQAVEWWGRA